MRSGLLDRKVNMVTRKVNMVTFWTFLLFLTGDRVVKTSKAVGVLGC